MNGFDLTSSSTKVEKKPKISIGGTHLTTVKGGSDTPQRIQFRPNASRRSITVSPARMESRTALHRTGVNMSFFQKFVSEVFAPEHRHFAESATPMSAPSGS
jgi:hypothetical protein